MNAIREKFVTDGYITGLQVLTPDDALLHRDHLERAEKDLGGPLHYLNKVHTILKSPFDLATHPKLLDAVESIIGPLRSVVKTYCVLGYSTLSFLKARISGPYRG